MLGAFVCVFVLLYGIQITEQALTSSVIIGGIFAPNAKREEIAAFKLAVEYVNTDYSLLKDTRIIGLVETAEPNDEFDNMEKAISLVQRGAVGIIGPHSVLGFEAIQRLCKELDVPQIAIKVSGLNTINNPCRNEYVLRMTPNDLTQIKGIVAFIDHFRWKRVAVLASNDRTGRNVAGHFETHLKEKDIFLTVEFFPVPLEEAQIKRLDSKLRHIKSSGARVIVLSCDAEYVPKILQLARGLGLTRNQAWILMDSAISESHILPNGSLPVYMRGLVGFRQGVGKGLYNEFFRSLWKQSGKTEAITPSVGRVFDAVRVLASGIQMMLDNRLPLTTHPLAQDFCNATIETKYGENGRQLSNYLRRVHTSGFMNHLNFNSDGAPSQAIYDVINYRDDKLAKAGNWSTYQALQFDRRPIIWPSDSPDVPREIVNTLRNRNITVVTFVGSPFVMLKSTSSTSKPQFEGAVIDFLNKLSEVLSFSYSIYLSPDGKVGVENSATGEWNGVIKELMEKKADLAVGPITINPGRGKVCDFTKPFMTSGLGAVMAVGTPSVQYFRFLSPFHPYLWAVIIVSVFGMAVVNWILSIFSPFGYYGRCAQARRKVRLSHLITQNNLSLLNSLWASAAYYLGQGPDGNHPVSGAGRVSVAVWWFCITILGATYTANLAAYLTTTRLQTPIRGVEDLGGQTGTEYGLVQNSQTQKFFEDSVIPRYQIMWEFMKLRRTRQVTTAEGLERAVRGKFAFIHDQPLLLYKSRKDYCGKMKVLEGAFGEAHYGFALPNGSPYTSLLSVEMLELKQKGEVKKMIDRWMVEKTPCKALDDDDDIDTSDTSRMGVFNMLGVFIFMLAGIVVGAVILVIEWVSAAVSDIDGQDPEAPHSFCSALCRRICGSDSKRVVIVTQQHPRKNESRSQTVVKRKLEYHQPLGKHGSTEL